MFKKLNAKNLFSWESLEYDFVQGISQITGHNFDDGTSEGSGKSSIPNILCWILYGDTPKNVNVDEVIREGETSARGVVELLDGTSIHRSRRPNELCILDAEGNVVKGKDAKETQKMIVDHLGMGFDTYCQMVYFAQGNPNKFIRVNDTAKAEVLSEIQDLTIFDRARKRTVAQIGKLEQEVGHVTLTHNAALNRKALLVNRIQLCQEYIARFDQEKAEKITTLERKSTQVAVEIDAIGNKLSQLDPDPDAAIERLDVAIDETRTKQQATASNIRSAEAMRMSHDTLTKAFNRNIADIIKLQQQLASYENLNECPTCGSFVDKTVHKHLFAKGQDAAQIISQLTAENDDLRKKLDQLTVVNVAKAKESLTALTEQLVNLEKLKAKHSQDKTARIVANNNIVGLRNTFKSLGDELIKAASLNCDKDRATLSQLELEHSAVELEVSRLKLQVDAILDKINKLTVLKDGFKEVKQYIFKSLLTELSNKSTKIAAELFEVPVKVRFSNEDDEGGISKIRTTVVLDGRERSLALLSGGQGKRVELSVDLALAGIVANRNAKPVNFRVFDEPMQHLSLESKEKVVELLRKLRGTTVLIEHDPIIKTIVSNTFHVEYRDGVSSAAKTL